MPEMAEAMELCSSTHDNPLKRPLPTEHESPLSATKRSEVFPTPPLSASPKHDAAMRDPSPAPSNSTLSSVATSTMEPPPGSTAQPAQKKRKLTPAEKEVRRVEKEQKKREREEHKAKKDEEKRMKDEEKRRKKEEREAKDRERDLEKQRKDIERQKKERAQMKLGNFFTKPKLPATSSPAIPASPAKELVTEMVRRKSLSVDSSDIPTTPLKLPLKREKTKKSDYERKFLPFQPPSYTTCAPVIPYPAHHDSDFDNVLERVLKSEPLTQRPPPISSIFAVSKGRSRGLYQPNAREVIESLNGSSQKPIDLESGESHLPHDLLKHVTIRHLHFAEDVRPPYVGSYTKRMTPQRSAKLRRNPFKRLRKDTNYDYDSEAEWEEPEEGEDILSDGEEDDESIGAPDEMEDFLDEDEAGPKRRLITGDLKPLNTGLCWEGTRTTNLEPSVDLDGMKLEFFIDLPAPSINPFSASYWSNEGAHTRNAAAATPMAKAVLQLENGKIMSPRLPLQSRSSTNGPIIIGAATGMSGPIMAANPGKVSKPSVKALEGEDLDEFREAVVDSNVPKTDLLKALKKRFPKHTNDTIKATLTECFQFSGSSRVEKRWMFAT